MTRLLREYWGFSLAILAIPVILATKVVGCSARDEVVLGCHGQNWSQVSVSKGRLRFRAKEEAVMHPVEVIEDFPYETSVLFFYNRERRYAKIKFLISVDIDLEKSESLNLELNRSSMLYNEEVGIIRSRLVTVLVQEFIWDGVLNGEGQKAFKLEESPNFDEIIQKAKERLGKRGMVVDRLGLKMESEDLDEYRLRDEEEHST